MYMRPAPPAPDRLAVQPGEEAPPARVGLARDQRISLDRCRDVRRDGRRRCGRCGRGPRRRSPDGSRASAAGDRRRLRHDRDVGAAGVAPWPRASADRSSRRPRWPTRPAPRTWPSRRRGSAAPAAARLPGARRGRPRERRGPAGAPRRRSTISSPSSTSPIGPPRAASGATWPIIRPWVPPEKRPSVSSATDPPRPSPTSAAVTLEHLLHARARRPGPRSGSRPRRRRRSAGS